MHDLTALIGGTGPVNDLWSGPSTLQAMLDVEAALAKSCASQEIMPADAVGPIVAACRADLLDIPGLMASAALGGNLAIPLVKQLTALVEKNDPVAAGYVHWGATSQDVIDTAMILQLRGTLHILQALLQELSVALATRARAYKDTPMVGRTWLQQALPITLGLKFSQYLDSIGRHLDRLKEMIPRVSTLQFGGAAGTLASLGDRAMAVSSDLASNLGLTLPDVPWHTQRDRIAEAAAWFGMVIGSLAKMARDISLLAQTEVGEVSEPAAPGKGGSSAMPHKRNPTGCAAVLTAGVRAPHLVGTVFSGLVQEHERALGGWQAEWDTIPQLAILAGGAVSTMIDVISGLEVHEDRLTKNLHATSGLILAEAVMLALGRHVGRMQAHEWMEQASRQASSWNVPLLDVLASDSRVTKHLAPEVLHELLDPANYSGQSHGYVDRVLATHEARITSYRSTP